MRLLLDTDAPVWMLAGLDQLSLEAIDMIECDVISVASPATGR